LAVSASYNPGSWSRPRSV